MEGKLVVTCDMDGNIIAALGMIFEGQGVKVMEDKFSQLPEQCTFPRYIIIDVVKELLMAGRKIAAIKLVRRVAQYSHLEMGLKEAKDFVEYVEEHFHDSRDDVTYWKERLT